MESTSGGGDVLIEEALLDVLRETDLLCYQRKLYVGLQMTRIEHFDHATDDDLIQLGGLAPPSVRRLREALDRKKKLIAKKKSSFFGNDRLPPGSNMVPVPKKEAGWLDAPESSSVQLNGSSRTSLIQPEEIKLMERLGEGTFATVKRAIWTAGNRKVDVAVKILKDVSADVMEDLRLEISNMQKLQHPNLIKLYGIVLSRPTMMVTELCDGGALLDRLRTQNKPLILMTTLVDFAQQIAKGMTYLESKHCVHRDLATRNVLLTDNDKNIKICDFGLMRCLDDTERLYVMSAPKKVPFSWCPPESLRYRQFSHASDVWAFGVTLWELFTYGEEPWVGYRAADVLKLTESGERLSKPPRASQELDEIMRMCWEIKPEKRPKFNLLTQLLKEVHFGMAECSTVHHAVNDGDLALNPRDKVIVINSQDTVAWFGQNVTSKLYGSFDKNTVILRSSPRASNKDDRISKPLSGSFVHTGHGDIQGGLSWGQPDKIDDIYLKNPVLKPVADGTPKRAVPTVIPTLRDVNSAASSPPKPAPAPKPTEFPSSQRHSNGRVKRNTISDFPVQPKSSSSPPPLPSIPPAQHRPLPNVHSTGALQASATIARVQGPTLQELQRQKEVFSTIDSDLKEQLANRRKLTEIPRPASGSRLSNGAPAKQMSVTPPPIRATDFTPAPPAAVETRQKMVVSELMNTVHQRPKAGNSDIRPMSAILPSGPDPFEVSSEIRCLADRDRYNDLFRSQTLATVTHSNGQNRHSGVPVLPTTNSPFAQAATVTQTAPTHAHSTSQLNQSTTVVQNRLNGLSVLPAYTPASTVFQNMHSAPTSSTATPRTTATVTQPVHFGQPTTVNLHNGQNRSNGAPASSGYNATATVTQNQSTSLGLTARPSTVAQTTQINCQTYSTTLPRPSASSNLSYASNRVALPPAQTTTAPPISHLPSYTQALTMNGLPPPSPLLLGSSTAPPPMFTPQPAAVTRPSQPAARPTQPNYSSWSSSSSSSSSYASYPTTARPPEIGFIHTPQNPQIPIDGELLALFDPLANGQSQSAQPAQPNQPQISLAAIEDIHKKASFASKAKCGQMLKKFNGDAQRAVQELKIGQLLEMGLVAERNRATAVLQQSNWDLNTAAASLLPS